MSNNEYRKHVILFGQQTDTLSRLIAELSNLPGLGERSAERLAFHMLKLSNEARQALADTIVSLKDIKLCQRCFNFIGNLSACGHAQAGNSHTWCDICSDESRDHSIICVVEQPEDLWKIEKTSAYKGIYHVLHGAISPLDGIGPDNINLRQLISRVKETRPHEIILSTNPTAEGDNTALYIQKELRPYCTPTGPVRITRLGRGIPTGSSIEYLNNAILIDAIRERKEQ